MTNRNFVKVSCHKHAIRVRFSGLSLWKLGMILLLSSGLWALCHKADGQLPDDFRTFSAGDAEEMHTYTVVDGLVGPVVPIIFQDSRGILWFGSKSGGVSRFDGETFEQFRLRDDLASGITQDDLASGITQQILEDKWGRIWFLTQLPTKPEGILSYFNGTDIETVAVATCMTVDRDGDIWAANDRELRPYRGTYASAYTDESERYQFPKTADARIKVLFQSKDGIFWLGGSAADSILILSFDSSASEFKAIDANITRDNKNETVDTAKSAPALLPAKGPYAIHTIAQGPYGVENLWFAGRNLLLRFDGEKLHQIQIRPDSQNMNQTRPQSWNPEDIELHHDPFEGHIWFSDRGTVRGWRGNNLRKLYQRGTGELRGTLKMQDTLGNLWFATPTGAYQYNRNNRISREDRRNKTYTVEEGLGSDNIQTIFEAEDGKIWFGHDNGVTVFNPQSAFVNFKTRPAIGSNSVRQIYLPANPVFSVLGGMALYGGSLYQQKLRPEYAESDVKSEKDMSPAEGEVAPNPIKSTDRHAEIVGAFRTWVGPTPTSMLWLINKPEHTPTETLYTFFIRFGSSEFNQFAIRVQTKPDQNRHSKVLILDPENPYPYIAFGGWLFKPYLRSISGDYGLKWFSPEGTRTFEFQSAPQFEDIPKHGPSTIIDMHRDPHGNVWCYLEDGTIQSYRELRWDPEGFPEVVLPEIVPMTHIKPLRLLNPKVTPDGSSENTAPKWFFNSEKKQIVYWDIEKLGEPIAVEGVFNAPPIAIWENANATVTTFIFSDRLRKYHVRKHQEEYHGKYHSTQLVREENISVAEVRAALLTDARVLWFATKQGAVQYNGTTLKTYGIEDGFLVNDLRDVLEDDRGHIWFATWAVVLSDTMVKRSPLLQRETDSHITAFLTSINQATALSGSQPKGG